MCVFANCSNKMLMTEHSNVNVKLSISTTKDVVYDTINIVVSFGNYSANDIYLLNKESVTISDNKAYTWTLKVLFQDTILMMSPINFLSRIRVPTKEDYFLLTSGEVFTFSFNVDFTRLARNPLDFGKINNDFGEYTVKLIYKDPFLTHRRAFRGTVESNTIRVLYGNQ